MYSRELWISAHVCFRGGGRKSYVFSVFLTKLLRSVQCVLKGTRAPSLIRVVGATQARYDSDRSSRRGELGVVGGRSSRELHSVGPTTLLHRHQCYRIEATIAERPIALVSS